MVNTFLLVVIATSLSIIEFQGMVNDLKANSYGVQRIAICNVNGFKCMEID